LRAPTRGGCEQRLEPRGKRDRLACDGQRGYLGVMATFPVRPVEPRRARKADDRPAADRVASDEAVDEAVERATRDHRQLVKDLGK